MKKQKGFTVFEMFLCILFLVGSVGWIWNIVKIALTIGDTLTGIFIARCIGVFVAPVGAVLGYL